MWNRKTNYREVKAQDCGRSARPSSNWPNFRTFSRPPLTAGKKSDNSQGKYRFLRSGAERFFLLFASTAIHPKQTGLAFRLALFCSERGAPAAVLVPRTDPDSLPAGAPRKRRMPWTARRKPGRPCKGLESARLSGRRADQSSPVFERLTRGQGAPASGGNHRHKTLCHGRPKTESALTAGSE